MRYMKGYKAFNKDMTNRYGMKFEEGKTYSVEGELKFGVKGNGFHFCKRLEDTLRYVPGMNEEIAIAKVSSTSKRMEYVDEYYDYYDMYVCRTLKIDKILSREEIVKMFLYAPPQRVIRFVSGYKLTEEEIELFREIYKDEKDVLKAISYHQEHDLDAYSRDYYDYKKVLVKEK